jgi:hypothetical protein
VFLDSLARGQRKPGHHSQVAGNLEGRQPLPAVVEDLFRVWIVPVGLNEGEHFLASDRIRHRHTGGVANPGLLTEHGLHLPGGDVLAAPPDHVLGPSDEVVIAIVVLAHQVAGVGPAVSHPFGGRLGVVPISERVDRTPADELADFTPGHVLSVGIDESALVARQHPPDRSRPGHPAIGERHGHDEADLGGSVPLAPRHAPASFELGVLIGRDPRTGDPTDPVPAVDGGILRLFLEQHRHCPQAVEEGAADVPHRSP